MCVFADLWRRTHVIAILSVLAALAFFPPSAGAASCGHVPAGQFVTGTDGSGCPTPPKPSTSGSGGPIFMPKSGSGSIVAGSSFDFSGSGGGTRIKESASNKIMAISSSIHKQTARLVTTAMGLNQDPTVTILDSSGNVVYSHTAVESTMVNIIFSDTGAMPEDVSHVVGVTHIVLKTNETYYYKGSVTPTGGSSPKLFRMEVYDLRLPKSFE